MVSRTVLLCLQALLLQQISAQCIGAGYNAIPDGVAWAAGPGLAPYPWEAPCALAGERIVGLTLGTLAASNCRGFTVRSMTPAPPIGIFVTSENVFDGTVMVTGNLPFLSAASLEGTLASVGSGLISYGCGNGDVAILSEDIAPIGYGAPGYGPIGPFESGLIGAPIVAPLAALEYGPYGAPYGLGPAIGCGCPACASLVH